MIKDFKLDKKNIEDIVDLTSLQEGILYHYLRDATRGMYFIQLSLELEGLIVMDVFKEAWKKVVENNEMLRTVFRWEKLSKPVQVILKEYKVDFRYFDLSKLDVEDSTKLLSDIKEKDYEENFDLREIPFRLTLCKFKNDKHILIISNHHIIYDGWSNGIILNEFLLYYSSLVNGTLTKVRKKNSFKSYIKFNRDFSDQSRSFWKDYLNGYESNCIFNFKRENLQLDNHTECYKCIISKEKALLLKKICELHRTTIADILYNAWGILLYKYSGNNDIVFGTTVSGRSIKLDGIEEIVGLFINTIPLRLNLVSNKPIIDNIKENSIHLRERGIYENVPLYAILNESNYSGDELFESIFLIENYPLNKINLQNGEVLTFKSFDIRESTNYKLTVSAFLSDEIEISFIFNKLNFNSDSIENINKHFLKILDSIIHNEESNFQELELLPESERHKLLNDFNNTEADYPRDKTIHQLFEEQVERAPDSTALVYKDGFITYHELNIRSNQLAHLLLEKGIKEELVGLMLNRSINTLIGILGILKSGNAYVPIDIKSPKVRLNYLFKDSGIKLLLSETGTIDGFDHEINSIHIDELEYVTIQNKENPFVEQGSLNAYLLYTSGSTGVPKGVLVNHQSVINLLSFLNTSYEFKKGDIHFFKTPYIFDVSVSELYGWILSGGQLSILEEGLEKSPTELISHISRHQISYVNFVPSMFSSFVPELETENIEVLKSLKYIFLAGEALQREHIETFINLGSDIKLENLYGPTEATVYSSTYSIGSNIIHKSIPIGKGIFNTELYIIDQDQCLQPIGVAGELCISGDGLSLGYLNRPELTSEKFIDHPYKEGECLYRTGDLARMLPDGNIEYLGRLDDQVKIRGFRIELGEIESCLLKHDSVREAVVVSKEDSSGDKYLCAYIVTEGVFKQDDVRTFLSTRLPDYMIPSYFVELDKIPLTSNGKLDRKSLPEPDVKAGRDYVAPSTLIESKLVKIWSDVLGISGQEISTRSSFFNLGGHSLKVTVLVSRIHKDLDVRLELKDIFQHQTIQGQAGLISRSSKSSYSSIPKAKEQAFYALSSSQRRLYLLQQMDLSGVAYNMPGIISVPEDLSKLEVEEIFKRLISRHEILRTSFNVIDEHPVQCIHESVDFKLVDYIVTNSGLAALERSFVEPFDLSHAPLLRVGYVRVEDGHDVLLVDMHHIISDGHSHAILSEEFSQLASGQDLAPLRLQYKDYSEWQNSEEQQARIADQRVYWLERFTGELSVLNLPTNYVRPNMQDFSGNNVRFVLSSEETGIIRNICRSQGLTPYMALLSVFNILLMKLSGQEDLVVGSPIAARRHSDLDHVVGMFVNTLAIRSEVSGASSLGSYHQQLKDDILIAYENQEYQFEDLVEEVVKERDTSRNPLFDVMFSYQEGSHLDIPTIDADELEHRQGVSKFDLSLTAVDYGSLLELNFEYCTKLFQSSTIDRFIGYLRELLKSITENSNCLICELNILPETEKQQLLYEFNETKVFYARQKSIPQIFNEQVKEFSKKIALEDKYRSYTYQHLDEESNRIGNYLKNRGVKENQLVGLMAGRSSDMIIGILGILKSGGAYAPIDPTYPKERVNQLIQDSEINILLSTEHIDLENNFTGDIINIGGVEIKESSTDLSLPYITSDNLAYLMYTSGSTGTPKGVVIEQKSILRLVQNNQFFPFHSEQKILLTGSPVFDATTFEIWGALLNGGSLYIASNDVIINAYLLGECIRENSITSLWLTSSLFNQLVDQEESIFDSLNYLLVGGDVLSVKHINKIKARNSELVLINGYGPTENTTFSSTFNIDKEYDGNIPIGKPISNSTAYIFDRRNKLQPIGVAGELLVGGDGLSKGYLNNPELTAEKFIDHPLIEGERLYRTGDLAHWLPDGNIQFLGRIDQQVKIRGFRIELGEIESCLLKHDSVREAVVVSKEDSSGDKYLCAYIVTEGVFKQDDVRTFLSTRLPDYMIPSYFVELDKIPLTSNGKLDRKSLPEPDVKAGRDYVAPSTLIESKLVKIWSDVLGISGQEISTRSSFFNLGGHSLKVTVLVSRIHKDLDVRLELKDIFQHQTIQGQAGLISRSSKSSYSSIPKAKEQAFYALSSSQRRLYLLQQMDLSGVAYNMPGIISVPEDLSKLEVEEIFKRLISRHEILRTSFNVIDEHPVQCIHESVDFKLVDYIVTNSGLAALERSFVEPFDLSHAPLLRVGYVRVEDGHDVLLVDMHHIISDGHSHAILSEEFSQLASGQDLAPLRLQYKDYSEWQNSEEQQARIADQRVYWLERFTGELSVLNLPTNYVRPNMQDFSGNNVRFVLSSEETGIIRNICRSQGLTPYMALLSVFNILLMKLSGQEDLVVGSPIAARRHSDLDHVVGMFVNTLAIRSEVSGASSLGSYHQQLKDDILIAYENQEYQFEDLVEEVVKERDTSRNPLFDVMFSYQEGSHLDIPTIDADELEHRQGVSKFDLSLTAVDYGSLLELNFEYCTKLFQSSTIDRFIGYLRELLKSITENSNCLICELNILPETERHKLLNDFNNTEADYPRDKTIHQLFEEQVERTPDKVAIIQGYNQISYCELNRKSNLLAYTLIEYGVKPNYVVSLYGDRSIDMIISQLAILKAGGAFLPIDSLTPIIRCEEILTESKTEILITQNKFKDDIRFSGKIIDIENEKYFRCNNYNQKNVNKIDDLVYVIYTSGSSGKPKGVMIEHRNYTNAYYAWKAEYNLTQSDLNFLQIASLGFDVFEGDLARSLLNGGKLILCPNEARIDLFQLLNLILKNSINIFESTPGLILPLLEYAHLNGYLLKDLDLIIIGSDSLNAIDYIKVQSIFGNGKRIINSYGVTEATIDTSFYEERYNMSKVGNLPIGRPMPNMSFYVLNDKKKLQPIGVSGELCIGGEGLSRGYLDNVYLTNEKFISHPFKEGERLYRTGDLGRWLPDGNMEFLGRIDHQVKIRGYRIELGEIEIVLLKHKYIKECIVIDREERGDKYLCAYIVSQTALMEDELHAFLSTQLPDYMIPSYFVEIDKIPLTSNGKLDRKSLPEPEIKAGNDYVGPSNDIEEKLVAIWAEVLKVSPELISTTANFFSIGGHSLKAMVMISLIQKIFNVKITLIQIFKDPTIKLLASCISLNTKEKEDVEYYELEF